MKLEETTVDLIIVAGLVALGVLATYGASVW